MDYHKRVRRDVREIIRRAMGHGCPHVKNKPCAVEEHNCQQCVLDWGTTAIMTKIIREHGDV